MLENNIEIAADIHIDIEIYKLCMHSVVLEWLQNYDDMTSGQVVRLYYALITTTAHIAIESKVRKWNHISRHFNLYAITIGHSGVRNYFFYSYISSHCVGAFKKRFYSRSS